MPAPTYTHTPLLEILELIRADAGHIVDEYLEYKGRVCRQVYADASNELETRLEAWEAQWSAYKKSLELVPSPAYLRQRQHGNDDEDEQCNTKRAFRLYKK